MQTALGAVPLTQIHRRRRKADALKKMRELKRSVYGPNNTIQTYRENLSSYLAQLEQLRSQLEHSK